MAEKIQTKCTVSLCRAATSDGGRLIVTVQDAASGAVVCEVSLTPEQAFQAQGGTGYGEGTLFPAGAENWGKTMENMRVLVVLPSVGSDSWGGRDREAVIREAIDTSLAELAPKGWKVDASQYEWNVHRVHYDRKLGRTYSVNFFRHVF